MAMTTKTIKTKKLQTTVGDLIIALTDAARRVTANERAAYRLADFIFNRMLQPAPAAATRRIRVYPRTKSNSLPH
jgi:hypothetical protein